MKNDPKGDARRLSARVAPKRRPKVRLEDANAQPALWRGRVLVWFSCGAASAVALKAALEKYVPLGYEVLGVYCDTSKDEHPDNARFLSDVERWLGVKIVKLKSEKYDTVFDVFDDFKFIMSPQGAPCTGQLKRAVGNTFRAVGDVNVYGYTADPREIDRALRYIEQNFDQLTDFVLVEAGITKAQCFDIVKAAGIELPVMYRLGFANNNCLGCVKVRSLNYWLKIRHYFPQRFARMAAKHRELNFKLIKFQRDGIVIRWFLDEIPADMQPDLSNVEGEGDAECGVLCTASA